MLKIGRTTNSVLQRVYQQRTAMPEDPVLYFVFGLGESDFSLDEAEKKVHDHLNVIGHRRASNSGGGREWFLTNFDSVLSVAEILKLELEFDLFLEEDAEESDTPD